MNELIALFLQNIDGFMMMMARSIGFAIMFTPFKWAGIDSGMLRMAFVLAISLPVVLFNLSVSSGVGFEEYTTVNTLLIIVKEVFLGFILGWIAAKPLDIAVVAGGIMDSYRNASSGDPDPAGGQITVYSKILFVAAIIQFVMVGGLWLVADFIYKSYQIWPLTELLPAASSPNFAVVFELMGIMLASAAVLAGPLVFAMIISDMFFLFAAKFGKNINTFHLAFTVKSLLALMLLPLNILVFNRIFGNYFLSIYATMDKIKDIF